MRGCKRHDSRTGAANTARQVSKSLIEPLKSQKATFLLKVGTWERASASVRKQHPQASASVRRRPQVFGECSRAVPSRAEEQRPSGFESLPVPEDEKLKGMVNELLDACVKITEALRLGILEFSFLRYTRIYSGAFLFETKVGVLASAGYKA